MFIIKVGITDDCVSCKGKKKKGAMTMRYGTSKAPYNFDYVCFDCLPEYCRGKDLVESAWALLDDAEMTKEILGGMVKVIYPDREPPRSAKTVLELNFQKIHERCCEKRDKENDLSGFHAVEKSDLWDKVHRNLRETSLGHDLWWRPEGVVLDDTGRCRVTIRYSKFDERMDDSKHKFSKTVFEYCTPNEVEDRVMKEREILKDLC